MMAFRRSRATGSQAVTARGPVPTRPASQVTDSLLPGHDSGPVLVAVDGRARGWDALDWAAAEAAARQCALRVVHVISWPPLIPEQAGSVSASQWDEGAQRAGELALSEAVRRARAVAPELRVTTYLLAGTTAPAIMQASDQDALIVVGRSREAGRLRSLMVPVSWQLARNASCPVAVIGLSGEEPRGPSAGRVVVGIGATADPAALGFAFRAARRRAVGLTVLHARGPQEQDGAGSADAANGMPGPGEVALRVGRDFFPDVAVRSQLVAGPAGSALVAESAGAALVVLGSRGPGRRSWTRHSSLRDVLRSARSPVVMIR
jgi:nucleotide-binding universal stress UspA family protein